MFSKYVTLLAFAASAIAGVIEPGIYRITNVVSHSTARTYEPFSPVYVSSTREYVGRFELWDIKDSEDGGYTLQNVGLGTYAVASPGEVVVTAAKGTSFNIEPAGGGQFVIKLPDSNSAWNAEPPVIPRGIIIPRPADGRPTQRWILTRPVSAQDDSDERWELLQRIGRFLGQF